jgi:hypothetical protein
MVEANLFRLEGRRWFRLFCLCQASLRAIGVDDGQRPGQHEHEKQRKRGEGACPARGRVQPSAADMVARQPGSLQLGVDECQRARLDCHRRFPWIRL